MFDKYNYTKICIIFFFFSSVYNVGDGPTMGRALLSTEIFPLVAWLARVTQSGLKSAVEAQRAPGAEDGLTGTRRADFGPILAF